MLNHIRLREWDTLFKESSLQRSDYAKTLVSHNDYRNALKEQRIQIGDILAIKFYTDLDDKQYEFRKSFEVNQYDTDKDIINRHISKYYHWGKWLNHAICVYGSKIVNNESTTYYHGLSGKFLFSSLAEISIFQHQSQLNGCCANVCWL